jgi:hypothetical protein
LSRKTSIRPLWKLNWVFAAKIPRGTVAIPLQYRFAALLKFCQQMWDP